MAKRYAGPTRVASPEDRGANPQPADRSRPPGPTIDDDPRWAAVSARLPCPVCGATSGGCGVALDDGVVACARVPSEHPLESGGWLHPPRRRAQRRRRAASG